jgi:hypothetical protein
VPASLVRKKVTLRVNTTQLRIIDGGQEVTVHQRCYDRGQIVTHRDHRLEALKMRRRRRAGQWETEFDALGPAARQFHLKLLSMPVKAPRHLGRLLALVRLYGRKEVLAAIGQALEYQTYDAAYVEALVLQQRRRRDLPSPIPLRPKRSELIEDIHLEEPDPARYDRLFGSSNNEEPSS